MNPQVFALSEDLTVGEAITALQSTRDVEMVFYLYVVDERRHLVGVTSLRRLLLVSPETPLKRIMTADLISARVDMDQEEVARQVASYNLLAIPVVDEENKLVGIITVDDVIDVIKDEATEDIYRLAGVSGDERRLTPAGESLRKRLPWLGVNLVTAFLAASVVALFEGTIDRCTALAVFMPIVAGMGGNAGDADADGDRARHRARRADVGATRGRRCSRRRSSGSATASSLGIVAAGVAWVTKRRPDAGPAARAWRWSCNMFVAATAGTLVPLGLQGR